MTNLSTIFALPGFACSKEMYAPLAKEVSHLVALENWGMGERYNETFGASYALKDLASFHWQQIKKENPLSKVVLLGTSMGGFLVQEMAQMFPERVSGLIFLCTLGPTSNGFISPTPLTEEGLRLFATFPKEQQALYGTEGTVHPSLKEKFPERYRAIYEYRLTNKANLEESIKQNDAAIEFLNGSVDFEKISHLPTLILHGTNDRFVNPENAKILHTKFRQSTLLSIDEADHFFFMEKPEKCAEAINAFLAKIHL